MQKETWSVGFACALGACIGTLVALEIAARFTYGSWFWSVGALTGGLAAYCAVDFRHLCAGIAVAYRRTIAWRPHVEWWKTYLMCACSMTVSSTSLVFVLWCITNAAFAIANNGPYIPPTVLLVYLCLFAGVGAVWAVNASDEGSTADGSYDERLLRNRKKALRAMCYVNPVGALLLVLAGMLVGAGWLWTHGPDIARSIMAAISSVGLRLKRFGVEVFFYVHSERRMICFLDAAIGAAAGYFLGSASLGAIIGAILGVINYEIVSIRWLKIIPAKKAE